MLWLKEELELAYCDVKGVAQTSGELFTRSTALSELDGGRLLVGNDPKNGAVEDSDADAGLD
jgi:hypothetical protein